MKKNEKNSLLIIYSRINPLLGVPDLFYIEESKSTLTLNRAPKYRA